MSRRPKSQAELDLTLNLAPATRQCLAAATAIAQGEHAARAAELARTEKATR